MEAKSRPRVELLINFVEYYDAIIMEENSFVEDVYELARRTIKVGGLVKWQRKYSGDSHFTDIVIFETDEDFAEWRKKINEFIKMYGV